MNTEILKHIKFFGVLTFCFVLASCTTPQRKRSLAIGAGFLTGTLIGAATAPANERRELHAVYWGGIAGVTAGLVSNYMYDDSEEIEKLQLQTQNLKKELELIQSAKMIQKKEGRGKFQDSSAGNWKLFEVDRWVKESPYRLHHIDQVLEVTPDGPSGN
ncbi:MAG: hypothetical protein V4736_10885 [Bdellovibrionota bacterium]